MRLIPAALLATAAVLASTAPASAQTPLIQPGAAIESGGKGCTLAWIFDGRPGTPQQGGVYAATAAHCVAGPGAVVNIRPQEEGGPGAGRIGVVAFQGDPNAAGRDYSFIAIDPWSRGRVNPMMKGWAGIPNGLPRNPRKGDQIAFSGYGLGFGYHYSTRESRTGRLNRLTQGTHDTTGPISFGDSGGPVADLSDGGSALGIVNTVGAGFSSDSETLVMVGEGGTNVSFALADAAARGFHVLLRNANGLNAGLAPAGVENALTPPSVSETPVAEAPTSAPDVTGVPIG